LFDGDSAAIYRVSDSTSQDEVFNNAYLKNLIFYEHNGTPVHQILNEGDYALNVLKNTELSEIEIAVKIDSLKDIVFDERISIHKKYEFEVLKLY